MDTQVPPPPALASKPSRKLEFSLLAMVLALAAILRFHGLTRNSFWIDEGVSVAIARLDVWNFLRILWRREANMSFYYLLLRGWLLLGRGEIVVRSLSAIFGVVSVAVIYAVGARIRGRIVGLVAALLLALNAYHIRYSQEARGYSLAVLLSLLSSYFFLRMLDQPRRKHSWEYILTSVLAVYAHFYAGLVLLAQWTWLYFLSDGRSKQELFRCARWILVLLLPAAVFILTTGLGPIAWLRPPGMRELYVLGLFLSGGDSPGLLLLYLAAVALAVVLPSKTELRPPGLLFGVLWLALPMALVFLLSLLKPIFLYRYMIVCLPALPLLAAYGIARVKPKPLGGILLLALAGLSAIADAGLYDRGLDQPNEAWRAATAYILANAQSADAIIFYTAQGRMPYEFYASGSAAARPAILFPAHDSRRLTYLDFMGKPSPPTIATIKNPRVWLVLSHNDANTGAIQEMLAAHYAIESVKDFPGISVVLYQVTLVRN